GMGHGEEGQTGRSEAEGWGRRPNWAYLTTIENRYRTHLISILRKSQKPGFCLYFSSPNQKLQETRFLAWVNLRNRVSVCISRHPTKNSKKPGFSPA
ncbi:hypothetical protein, partial [Tychonema sp. LEGE 07203]|uniref:hypothetical protein n=1 Tax=Tychonema sp. LEGE 07203 TaxID=1828671 RepID=UPI001D138A16